MEVHRTRLKVAIKVLFGQMTMKAQADFRGENLLC